MEINEKDMSDNTKRLTDHKSHLIKNQGIHSNPPHSFSSSNLIKRQQQRTKTE